MRILKYLIFPIFTVFIMAQTALDQKVTLAAKEYKKGNYSSVINQLEKEPRSDYRVLFFYTLSKYKSITKYSEFEDAMEVYNLLNLYRSNFHDKNISYSNEVLSILEDFSNFQQVKSYLLLQEKLDVMNAILKNVFRKKYSEGSKDIITKEIENLNLENFTDLNQKFNEIVYKLELYREKTCELKEQLDLYKGLANASAQNIPLAKYNSLKEKYDYPYLQSVITKMAKDYKSYNSGLLPCK